MLHLLQLISVCVHKFFFHLNSSLRRYDHTNRWSLSFVSDCVHFTPWKFKITVKNTYSSRSINQTFPSSMQRWPTQCLFSWFEAHSLYCFDNLQIVKKVKLFSDPRSHEACYYFRNQCNRSLLSAVSMPYVQINEVHCNPSSVN